MKFEWLKGKLEHPTVSISYTEGRVLSVEATQEDLDYTIDSDAGRITLNGPLRPVRVPWPVVISRYLSKLFAKVRGR